MRSLRSDLSFVISRIGTAILQIIGVTCREIADRILGAEQKVNQAPPAHGSKSSHSKEPSKREKEPKPSPKVNPEPEPEFKPRVRSREYEARDHNQFKLAAIDILRHYLNGSPPHMETVRQLHEVMGNNSESMVRKACNILVEDGVMSSMLPTGGRATVYWVSNVEAAQTYLDRLEESAPTLPVSEGTSEPDVGLH